MEKPQSFTDFVEQYDFRADVVALASYYVEKDERVYGYARAGAMSKTQAITELVQIEQSREPSPDDTIPGITVPAHLRTGQQAELYRMFFSVATKLCEERFSELSHATADTRDELRKDPLLTALNGVRRGIRAQYARLRQEAAESNNRTTHWKAPNPVSQLPPARGMPQEFLDEASV